MLLDQLELPADLAPLYVVSGHLSDRSTPLLAAMHVFVIGLGWTAMLTGSFDTQLVRTPAADLEVESEFVQLGRLRTSP